MTAWFAILSDWLKQHQPHLAAVASIITIIGVPIGVAVFIWEKRRERIDREYGTYLTLSSRYIEFLKMCFANPDLEIYETYLDESCLPLLEKKDPKIVQKELILYTIFITMCEEAFLIYLDHSSKTRTRQWAGWEEYIREYCLSPNFRMAWKVLGRQFDSRFVSHINKMLQETIVRTPQQNDSQPHENSG